MSMQLNRLSWDRFEWILSLMKIFFLRASIFLYVFLIGGCQHLRVQLDERASSKTIVLFDGSSLDDWKATDFAGKGEISIDENGSLILEMGAELSGVHWQGKPLPTQDYEISLQAKRTMGSDFFCGLTFPYKDSHATLILGGWGGSLIGISSIDDFDASENETGDAFIFEDQKWYDVRLRVTESEFTVWIDEEEVIDLEDKLAEFPEGQRLRLMALVKNHEERETLSVILPPLRISRPNLDEAAQKTFTEGTYVSRDASADLARNNSQQAERKAAEFAKNPEVLSLARQAAKDAVRQNLAIPMQVAGYGDVSVEVRFDGEPAPE